MLAQWSKGFVKKAGRRAWIALDEHDNLAGRFLAYLCFAFQDAGFDSAALIEALQSGASVSTSSQEIVEGLAWRLQNAGPILLILDDYHEITSREIHQIVNGMLRLMPANVSFAVGSRNHPPLDLVRLQYQGNFVQIGPAELRLRSDEISQLWPDQPPEAIATVEEQTEGWPAAVQLLRLTSADCQPAGLRAPPDDLAVALIDGLFNELSEPARQLLVETALLDRLEVARLPFPCGLRESILAELGRLSPLFFALEQDGRWARHHALVRDYLRKRFDALPTAQADLLRTRTVELLVSANAWEAAVRVALAVDPALALQVYARAGGALVGVTDSLVALRAIISMLVAARVEHPCVDLGRCLILVKEGQNRRARNLLKKVEGAIAAPEAERPPEAGPVGIQPDLAFVRMILDILEDKAIGSDEIQHVEALLLEPSIQDHWFYGWLNNWLCVVAHRQGHLQRAEEACIEAIECFQRAGVTYTQIFMYMHLTLIRLGRGELAGAEEACAQIARVGGGALDTDKSLRTLCRVCQALVSHQGGDSVRANELLRLALPDLERAEGWMEILAPAYGLAARLAVLSRGLEAAFGILDQAARLAQARGLPALARVARLQRIDVSWIADRADRIADFSDHGPGSHTAIGWREALLEQTAKIRLLIQAGDLSAADRELRLASDTAGALGLRIEMARLSVLSMISHSAGADFGAALEDLTRALRAVGHEQFLRVTLDEGAPAASAVAQLCDALSIVSMPKDSVKLMSELLCRSHQAKAGAPARQLFSGREMDILALLKDRRSNKVIARTLDVTEATVKFHVQNIFRKLGVHKREMAATLVAEYELV